MAHEGSFINPAQQALLVVDVDEDWRDAINRVDSMARTILGREYHIVLTHNLQATTIAYVYMSQIFAYLKEQMEMTGDTAVNFNFLDLIEAGITLRRSLEAEKEGNLGPTVSPGYQAKLLIKSDAMTEDN